jgi:hypothetical protein
MGGSLRVWIGLQDLAAGCLLLEAGTCGSDNLESWGEVDNITMALFEKL